MKHFLGIIGLYFLATACSDGNLVVENINFDTTSKIEKCTDSNLIYKLKGNEAFVISFADATSLSNLFQNNPTLGDDVRTLDLNDSNVIYYNFYNGAPTFNNICTVGGLAPINPSLVKQWKAKSGKLVVTTAAIIDVTDKTNNSTKITGYRHLITFSNTTFIKDNGVAEGYDNKFFGEYIITTQPITVKANSPELKKCNTTIYGIDLNNALTLDLDPAVLGSVDEKNPTSLLLGATVGASGTIKTSLNYTLYKNESTLSDDMFCAGTKPTSPTINQVWKGNDGVAGLSGIVEISKKTTALTRIYTLVFKNVSLSNDNNSFKLGDSFVFGTYTEKI